jgi:chromosome segregation protein
MHLTSLTLSGFKSFAKKTDIRFDVPVTAIVGPNGSGKSNVADAFRFVLGEQSMKSLRSKRGEELIWGGGTGVARANRASVRLVLNNASRTLPIDFDEVVLERTVYRDGVQEYLLNDTKVRLKDITELLSAARVGSSGYESCKKQKNTARR